MCLSDGQDGSIIHCGYDRRPFARLTWRERRVGRVTTLFQPYRSSASDPEGAVREWMGMYVQKDAGDGEQR